MATLGDIAQALGTTKGTVSKALNGASDVSEATRKAVLEKAVELGYSKITRRDGKRICIFIKNMSWENASDFGHDIVIGFRKMAEPAGYTVDVIDLTDATEQSISFDSYMLLHDYKGALFLGLALNDAWMKDFRTCQTPAVLFDAEIQFNPRISTVGVDNEEAMKLTVEHLTSLGHRKIGYLSAALGSYIFQIRQRAFRHAIRNNTAISDRIYARNSYLLADTLGKDLPWLIEQGCTAIVCSHDDIAHAVLIHCQSEGISVPGQLSVFGFDDLPSSQYTVPPLTTIRQDRTEIGKSAFFALSSQFNQVHLSEMHLHPELIERKSTGAAYSAASDR